MSNITEEWTEIKQFKDPVYGYIPVSRPYVKYLIDTPMMQRIKGVAQTGLRPVFSSATHDRFSHSLGVFKFGMEMYDSFAAKLKNDVNSLFQKWFGESGIQIKNKLNQCLQHWKTLLSIGCLLHDIGHPVQSHGFEFLFDDPYLDVEYDPDEEPQFIGSDMSVNEQDRVFELFKKIKKDMEKTPEGNLRNALLTAFQSLGDHVEGSIPGSPHERMSAYYIFKDKKLLSNIKILIRSSREKIGLKIDDSQIDQDICFIARMIIGMEYRAEEQLSFDDDSFFNSVKNCVIHILNGKIDADGIDYLMRNSYAAGYDTSKIDSTRLCNAYSLFVKNYLIFPAFSKSALSVLEGYMAARNFEPKWLYSHHKVVYADLLTKRLYKYITRYLTDQAMLLRSIRLFLKHAEKSTLVYDGEQNFGSDLMLMPGEKHSLNINEFLSHMEHWSYPFYTYLLAPCRKYSVCARHFSKTADADLDALIHEMNNELAHYKKESDQRISYEKYIQRLKSQIADSMDESYLENNIKAFRILLAETCLTLQTRPGNGLSDILKSWVENGDTNTTLSAMENWDGTSADKASIMAIIRQSGSGSGKELLQCWMEQYKPLLLMDDFSEFLDLLDEYATRNYRKSLWKSYPEYRLFIKDCADCLGYSFDDVDRYMITLIEDGMKKHGFSIFDGKAVKNPPELYREQFFYQQDNRDELGTIGSWEDLAAIRVGGSTPKPKDNKKHIIREKARIIFSEKSSEKRYDFSRTKLVVTLYRIKSKKFDGIPLLFGNRHVPLEEVLPSGSSGGGVFPYFYYKTSENPEENPEKNILNDFQADFLDYCRAYRACEVRSEAGRVGKNYVFRDAIYGDIEMPTEFYAVICTREFQRLGHIRQLATADRVFPNATHTRLAHSIGTWHVMRLILQHFKQQNLSVPQLEFSNEDENVALLAALLHDLGHGPYSHAIENAFGREHFHEEMTRKIILDKSTEVAATIEAQFGPQTAERICNLLDDSSESGSGIHLIYRTLISGQLDADRIDYLLRDNVACGMSFGHIDIQQLIASMRILPVYERSGKTTDYQLCFDDRYLPAIDQFVYARYQMYRNVYYTPQKLLFEQIIRRIFLQASHLCDKIKKNSVFKTLMRIRDGSFVSVSEYIALDDESMNALIKQWASGDILEDPKVSNVINAKKDVLMLLSQAFLDHHILYEQVDLRGKQQQYDLLAKRVANHLGYHCTTFQGSSPDMQTPFDEDYNAFIFVQGEMYAYKKHAEGKKNIVLRDLADGTTRDYISQSIFLPVGGDATEMLMKTDYCYLFFSKKLLEKDCEIHEQPGKPEMIFQMVESAKPRKNIEIEKKFRCHQDGLTLADEYLSNKYPNVGRNVIDYTDTYYDCVINGERKLYAEKYGFRCRVNNNCHTFTVKTPVASPNYNSESEFARHEYEFASSEADITDEVYQFLTDTVSICGNHALLRQLNKANVQALLIVCNHRITYHINGKCDICLDSVRYKSPDGKMIDDGICQIEIELLDEPEKWSQLEKEIIEPLIKNLEDSGAKVMNTTESKLEIGLKCIGR